MIFLNLKLLVPFVANLLLVEQVECGCKAKLLQRCLEFQLWDVQSHFCTIQRQRKESHG